MHDIEHAGTAHDRRDEKAVTVHDGVVLFLKKVEEKNIEDNVIITDTISTIVELFHA